MWGPFYCASSFFSSLLLRKIFTHLEQSVGSSDNRPLLWAVPSMVLQRKTKTYFSICRNTTPQTPFLGGYGFFLCTCNGINLSGGQYTASSLPEMILTEERPVLTFMPSKNRLTGTYSTWLIIHRRLPDTRLLPFSYFCTCWKVVPTEPASSTWLTCRSLRK